eukprot:19918-Heterococcus_DN1.PRE.2
MKLLVQWWSSTHSPGPRTVHSLVVLLKQTLPIGASGSMAHSMSSSHSTGMTAFRGSTSAQVRVCQPAARLMNSVTAVYIVCGQWYYQRSRAMVYATCC